MAVTAEQLNIILSAKDKQFNAALKRSQRQVDFFAKKSQRQLSKTATSFNGLGRAAKMLAPLLAGAFSVRAIGSMVNAASRIKDLAALAGTSTTEFQKLAAASKTVGIDQDKLSDIIKDVNDKVGDFLVTGAGPMADFFETVAPLVGVTADNFKDLSGPQALQLYVDSLDKANLSQSQMTFFMEAIASDATALLPLLRNNGIEMRRLGDEAQRTGRILDEDAIDTADELKDKFVALKDSMATVIQSALLDNADSIISIVNTFANDILPKIVSASTAIADLLAGNGGGPGAQPSAAQEALDQADAAAFSLSEKAKQKVTGAGQSFMSDPEFAAGVNAILEGSGISDAISGAPSTSIRPKRRPVFKTVKEIEEEKRLAAERNRLIQQASTEYDSMRSALDPLLAAQLDYNASIKFLKDNQQLLNISNADAIALQGQLALSFSRTQDEISGMAEVTDALEQGLTDTFMAALEGAKSMEDAFRSMAADVIRQLYRVLVVQQMVNAAMGFFGFSPTPMGGFTRTRASGGSVQSDTPYITGESGRELFVPSQSGRILSPAQSKSALSGGGGDVVVNQTINVTTGVQQTVRTEIKQLMPQIADSAKAAVVDAKRRGGSYGKAFA
jgi:hypothetical protein